MSNTAHFKVFCIERYKSEHSMNGKDTFRLFKEYGVLEYLGAYYDVLHTFGEKYIIADIDKFIKTRQTV